MEIAFLPQTLLRFLPERHRAGLNASVSALVVLLAVPFLPHVPHRCLFRTLLHVPCPGCGITHALLALEGGHLAAAWQANPAGLCLAAGLLFQLAVMPFAASASPAGAAHIAQGSRYLSRLSYAALGVVWAQRLF